MVIRFFHPRHNGKWVLTSKDFNPRSYPLHFFPISNFIYFTTITKHVIQLILIMLFGTNVCVRMVFVWEETGVPGGNPPVWLGGHMTISHADALCTEIWSTLSWFLFPQLFASTGGLQTQETSKQLIADTLYRLTNTLTHMQNTHKKPSTS